MKKCLSLLLLILFLTQCEGPRGPLKDELVLRPATFAELQGWQHETFKGVKESFAQTCKVYAKQRSQDFKEPFGDACAWKRVCKIYTKMKDKNPLQIKEFFERYFQPLQVMNRDTQEGLFTGYYEPELLGSLSQTADHAYPLYKKPHDFKTPYFDRKALDKGALHGKGHELLWVACPIDAFFLHIQGSGRVRLEDGTLVRVGYAGQNGHPYHPIGRTLLDRGVLTQGNVSMQAIKKWLRENPEHAFSVMHENASYVFFKILETEAPLGAFGTPLVAGRALAVDKGLHSLGMPMWIDVAPPVPHHPPLRRMMFAHDTGGAIKGAVRGDVFWGAGSVAEYVAGHMKSQGKLYVLVPKDD